MNKAVEFLRRYPFRAVVALWLAALTVFLLLNTVGLPGSSWDACEDARIRQREALTDTMFRYARADVKEFCEPDEAWPTATSTPSVAPVILVEQDWDGQTVTTALAKLILEEEMGYTVETKFAPADSAQLFEGLASGEMHWVCCNWPAFSASLLAYYADTGKVTRQGSTGIVGTSHFYVPRYVIEGDADRGIDPMAPDLRSYADLNKYKDLFATADTSPKGRFLDFTPGWDYRNEERLAALGVDYEVVFSGSEAASFAELDAAHKRGEPILLVVWTPHWAVVKYDLVSIELPAHSDCYPVTEKFDCGYGIDDVTKLTWPGLEKDIPKAYEFLENFQITNDQQTAMVITKTDESKTDAEAARVWKDANEDIWKTWIP